MSILSAIIDFITDIVPIPFLEEKHTRFFLALVLLVAAILVSVAVYYTSMG